MDKHWVPADMLRELIDGAVRHASEEEPLDEGLAVYHIAFDILDGVERSLEEYADLWGWSASDVRRQWPRLSMQASGLEAAEIHLDQLK